MSKKVQRRWIFPDSSVREYQRNLLDIVRAMNAEIRGNLFPELSNWAKESPLRSDAWTDSLTSLLDLVARAITPIVQRAEGSLSQIFDFTDRFNKRQYSLTVKQMTGVDVFAAEPWLKPMREQWVAENVRLIKSIPAQHLSDVEGVILRGVQEGKSATVIQKELQRRFRIPKNRAKLIAQDQVSKVNSQMTQQRLRQIDVDRYYWRTMKDSRVRKRHKDREGKIFRLDKPPSDGHPGQPIRCRCWMEAIFDD